MKRLLNTASILLVCTSATAQTQAATSTSNASAPSTIGSAAFCLFPLPAADNGNQRWVNLGIVQFVDVLPEHVLVVYGGGNFGSGHEIRIPTKSREEATAILGRLRQTAEECARRPIPPLILREDRK